MLVWVLAAAMVAGSLGVASAVSRFDIGGSEFGRKFIHIIGSFGAIGLGLLLSLPEVAVLMALMTIIILLSHIFRWPAALHTDRRRGFGDILLPLGALVAALLSPSLSVFVCGMLVVGLADSLAGLVGRQFATRPIWSRFSAKTYLGSATFFIVAILSCVTLLPIAWYAAFLVAAVLTTIEYFAPLGSDNLLLPLTVVLAAQILI